MSTQGLTGGVTKIVAASLGGIVHRGLSSLRSMHFTMNLCAIPTQTAEHKRRESPIRVPEKRLTFHPRAQCIFFPRDGAIRVYDEAGNVIEMLCCVLTPRRAFKPFLRSLITKVLFSPRVTTARAALH